MPRRRATWDRLFRLLRPYALSALAVAAAVAVAEIAERLVFLPHVPILLLSAVLISAVSWGLLPSLFASILSVVISAYFFYPPLYSFTVSDPQGMLDLVVFSIVAVVTSRLATQVKRSAIESEAERFREALINAISHDLRTPLSAIIGSASALQESGPQMDARARADLTATIREEADHLNAVITDVLDLSRIRAGAIRPRRETVELADVLTAALRQTQRRLADRRIVVEMPNDLPMVAVDLSLMRRALVNLLENAAKYSTAGAKIRLSAVANGEQVRLDVTDEGIGIDPSELDRIFDRFYRGASRSSDVPGSGLGLAICRAFVDANGGRVEAMSRGRGTGATFRVTLPAAMEHTDLKADESDE
jgi:two-component system sensor histidine kinase KdpD